MVWPGLAITQQCASSNWTSSFQRLDRHCHWCPLGGLLGEQLADRHEGKGSSLLYGSRSGRVWIRSAAQQGVYDVLYLGPDFCRGARDLTAECVVEALHRIG